MKKILMFTAPWCNPCKNMKPLVEQECREAGIELEYVDIESQIDIARMHGVRSVPTMMVFDGKFAKDMATGEMSMSALRDFIQKHK